MLSHLGAWHVLAAQRGDGFPPELIRLLQRPVAIVSVVYRTVSDDAVHARSAQPDSNIRDSDTSRDSALSNPK